MLLEFWRYGLLMSHGLWMAIWEVNRCMRGHLKKVFRSQFSQSLSHRGLALASWGGEAPKVAISGKQWVAEKLWRDFFADPSQWWDHRQEKGTSRFPDFKHKETKEGLWLDGNSTPSWVEDQLATIAADKLHVSLFSWNKRLTRHVEAAEYENALELFEKMKQDGVRPNAFTFVPILKACACLKSLGQGREVHNLIMKSNMEADVYVDSCLIDMYAKCGSMEDAWTVFNKIPVASLNVVTWSSMILGCVKSGDGSGALELFEQMQEEGVEPDPITFVGVLNACASVGALEKGSRVHKQINRSRRGYGSNVLVGNSLIDMYAKCGSMEDAEKVFDRLRTRTVVAWGSMILGYVKSREPQKALEMSRQMRREGVSLDPPIFVAVLNACAGLGNLEEGRRVHDQIIESGCQSDMFVGASLVDMYMKCGSVLDAELVFDKMPSRTRRNSVLWNSMLGGYAMHGLGNKAFQHLERMSQQGVDIDEVTFVSLLSACTHAGLVDEGLHIFESMYTTFGISPTIKHYSCLIHLLGHTGHLHEVEDLIWMMPGELNGDIWMSLLTACRAHDNVEMGERVGKRVMKLDARKVQPLVRRVPSNPTMLPTVGKLALAGENNELAHRRRVERGVKTGPGCTWISVNGVVHSFVGEDYNHPQILDIREELRRLIEQMEDEGYRPETAFVTEDEDEVRPQVRLCRHSEKLAVAFGLLSTPAGTPLRIFKNLRACKDCHDATKFISKMVDRDIIVRDTSRFHYFQDGSCSCQE